MRLTRVLSVFATSMTAASCTGPEGTSETPEHFARGRLLGAWCEECDASFLAGYRVPSRAFFETLDAHGHSIDPEEHRCETCREAVRRGGYCETCRHGYVDGLAYMSRLTYHLARAERRYPDQLDGVECRKCAESSGWCESCSFGRVREFEFGDREEFDRALREVRKWKQRSRS